MRNIDVFEILVYPTISSDVIRRFYYKITYTVIFWSFTTFSGRPGLGITSADKLVGFLTIIMGPWAVFSLRGHSSHAEKSNANAKSIRALFSNI